MGELSWWHWLIVIGVAVLLFGAKRLPDAARSLGQSTRILKAELRAQDGSDAPAPPSAPPQPAAPQPATPQPATDAKPPGS
ncbi:MAG: Sec-independent protein translocase subunit TatA [Pseudonocardia sp.]|uniref:Sec-independent protein translocase subunit TatA n=1 Tax=unclassified Pseudonocardia TaxID=2619320 RepID=UPI00086E0506|nr:MULTISPECIES: Sec-independent protein translocase subunit TatA [unclassified Pseudonocardia]MBN9111525.1 Sec-independent protein translocase subunit TatA [Pseudonocardia sp.]ODV02766.1 MAG: preprotein translocase subunit TatA [Pseudonocardia sp. SCN 73-27]